MTQGIGFPLRPVDGVPPQESGGTFDDIAVAGLFLQWVGPYQAGKYYAKGSVTRIDEFLMVALRYTLDYPGPITIAPAEWSIPSFTPATASENAVIQSGNKWTMTADGYLKTIRVWVPEVGPDITYKVLIIDGSDPDNPKTNSIAAPAVTAGAWASVKYGAALVFAGTVIEIRLEAVNAGSDTSVDGGWNYDGVNNAAPPTLQGWNRSQQHDFVNFDKTDLDGTNRNSELLGVVPTSTLTITDTDDPTKSFTYSIVSLTDLGTYVQYAVNLVSVGNGGPAIGVTTVNFTIPVPLATKYSREAAGAPAPSWATVEGTLYIDGVSTPAAADAHGTDIEFEEATISPDWAIMSVDT